MKRDIFVGVFAGVAAIVVLGRGRATPPVPKGVYQTTLDETKHREVLRALGVPVDAARESRRKLATRIEKFEVERMPLEDVVGYLADASGLDIVVDWKELELARDELVSVNRRDVTVIDALELSFASFAGQLFKPAYGIEAGRLRITRRGALVRDAVVRVYDLRDVLGRMLDPGRSLNVRRVPPSTLPTLALQPYEREALAGVSPAGAGSAGLFGPPSTLGDLVTSRSAAQDELKQFLTEAVDSASWQGVVGGFGTARWFDGVLVVSQTPANHEEIAVLLDWVREVLK